MGWPKNIAWVQPNQVGLGQNHSCNWEMGWTKQGPGQKSASIVGLAHYKPAYYVGWCNKSDVKAVVIKLCDIKTNIIDLWHEHKNETKTWFKAHGLWY